MMTYLVMQLQQQMHATKVSLLQNLIQKLKPGGRMVIPVGEQNAMQVKFSLFHKPSLQVFLRLQQFVSCCVLRCAEVCDEASYCCSCHTDCSMVVSSKGISHRRVSLFARHLPFVSEPSDQLYVHTSVSTHLWV